ncbi:MarR family winged helix-turn-helix transcriptional regulator [Jatrophihabitans sp. DSM 45814]
MIQDLNQEGLTQQDLTQQDSGVSRSEQLSGDSVSVIRAQWASERPELETTPMGIFGRIAKLYRAQIEASEMAHRHLGISQADVDVLATLRRSGPPYRLTPSQLTAQMMISSGGVTQRVDRLARLGLVERFPHESDRRSVSVGLTAEGADRIDQAMPLHLEAERAMLAGLDSAEITELGILLAKLLASVE